MRIEEIGFYTLSEERCYRNLAHCFHLNPETEEQMDARLGACEDQFATNAKIGSQ